MEYLRPRNQGCVLFHWKQRRVSHITYANDLVQPFCCWLLGEQKSNAYPYHRDMCGTHLHTMSHETTQKAHMTSQTPSPWWWSRLPLQSNSVDLMNLCRLRGGRPCICIYFLPDRCRKILIYSLIASMCCQNPVRQLVTIVAKMASIVAVGGQ